MENPGEEIKKSPPKKESTGQRVEVDVPEELRRKLVGEEFFSTMETSAQRTIEAEREQGFVSGLRLENLVPIEVATSEVIEGDERSIKLSLAKLQLENDLDVVSLLLLHTHTPGGPIQLSEDDITNWKEDQRRPAPSIENPKDGGFMRATNVRPVMMMLAPDPEDFSQSTLIALAQTEEARLKRGAVELAFDIVAGASLDEEEKVASLRESLAKVGFGLATFKLGQEEEIQEFILKYLPEKLVLEEAEIPKPHSGHGPDLNFLKNKNA